MATTEDLEAKDIAILNMQGAFARAVAETGNPAVLDAFVLRLEGLVRYAKSIGADTQPYRDMIEEIRASERRW